MNKIKYISLKDLKKQLRKVIEDVYKNHNEYIVMDENEPKAKIVSIDGKVLKELVFEKTMERDKLKKFIE